MDKVHKTHFTVPEMPWDKEEGMDKYRFYFYELAKYVNALADDCDGHSGLLVSHGITDPWVISREIFNALPTELKDHLQRLRGKEQEDE